MTREKILLGIIIVLFIIATIGQFLFLNDDIAAQMGHHWRNAIIGSTVLPAGLALSFMENGRVRIIAFGFCVMMALYFAFPLAVLFG